MDENDASIIAALQEPLLLLQPPRSLDADSAAETQSTAGESPPPTESSQQQPVATSENDVNHDTSPRQGEDEQQQRTVDGLPWESSVLVKSLFFLDALGSSTWGRFSAIYYNIHGLNSQQIGLIEGLRTAIPTLSMVLWGVVSDRFHCRKRVWVVTKSLSTCILLLLALPYVFRSFSSILVVSVSAQLFVSSGILDAYTLELLGSENKMYYGRYRLYASLSWGVGSIIMGWVTDHYGFDYNFVMFGVLSAMMIVLVTTKIPETLHTDNYHQDNIVESNQQLQPTHVRRRTGKIRDLVRLALRPRVTLFLLEVLVMGAGMATVERLLFLYMVNDLDASTLLCGLSVGVNVLFELPIFWYASPIMRVLGHDGMFLSSMVCFVVRVYGYTWLTPTTKWFILLLESMHGVTFATFWIVTTDVSKVLVETEGAFWSTAIPMSVQMLYSAVGVSVGSVLGGWAMHKYGSREMYTFTAACVSCMMLFHIVGSISARTCSNVGSLLPDFPHSTNAERNAIDGEAPFLDEFTGDVIPPSDENAPDGGDDDAAQGDHLTSTDIIQIGSLIDRDERGSPRGRSKSYSKLQSPISVLVVLISAPLVSTVSGFRTLTWTDSAVSMRSSMICGHQSIIDELVNETSSKQTKTKRRETSKRVQEPTEVPWHWMVESDPVVLDTDRQDNACSSGSSVSRVGFKVRGNPRPLRRHRTSRGHMYNPSFKYQSSFQDVVDKLLFSSRSELCVSRGLPLEAPIFPAERNLVMTIIFRMKRPKSHFVGNRPGIGRLKKTAPPQTSTIRTDVDNLTKFVLDSMNKVLYEDDHQIMSIHVTKLLDNDGSCEGSTEVYLRSIEETDVEHIVGTTVALTEKDWQH